MEPGQGGTYRRPLLPTGRICRPEIDAYPPIGRLSAAARKLL
jgi:hypothetical protein